MQVINGKEVFTTLEELVDPKHTAVLFIDLQNDYIMPGGYYDKLGLGLATCFQIIPHVKRVLEVARGVGILVVYVQMSQCPNYLDESSVSLRMQLIRAGHLASNFAKTLPSRCVEGNWGWQIIDELTPLANEVVIRKHRLSAFVGTDLDMILRSNSIKSVVIAGIVTQGCVMATADSAQAYEYYPVLLRDCIGSYEPQVHDAAFLVMSRKMDVTDSNEVLKIWTKKHLV